MSELVADAILLLHLVVVLFNVGSLPVIWLGWFRNWRFVRNFYFRTIHLLLIGFVAAETVLGAICPLTTWEDTLRRVAGEPSRYETGFIAHWVHRLIYYELPEEVFLAAYLVFFALVLGTFYCIKPLPPRWWPGRDNTRPLK